MLTDRALNIRGLGSNITTAGYVQEVKLKLAGIACSDTFVLVPDDPYKLPLGNPWLVKYEASIKPYLNSITLTDIGGKRRKHEIHTSNDYEVGGFEHQVYKVNFREV